MLVSLPTGAGVHWPRYRRDRPPTWAAGRVGAQSENGLVLTQPWPPTNSGEPLHRVTRGDVRAHSQVAATRLATVPTIFVPSSVTTIAVRRNPLMKPDKDGIREKICPAPHRNAQDRFDVDPALPGGAQVADRSLAPLCYPLWRDDLFHHNRLTMLYRPTRALWLVRQEFPSDDTDFRRERRKYRRFFSANLARQGAVISAEDLCGLALPHVAQLRADLESVGYRRFHVVLYVRDPLISIFPHAASPQLPTGEPNSLLSREKFGAELTATTPQFLIEPNSFVYDFRRAAETGSMYSRLPDCASFSEWAA